MDVARADTHVTGSISIDTVWTSNNNPYVIGSSLRVERDATLSIDPGVHVKIGPSGGLFIDGNLHVGSSFGESVIVTSLKDDSVDGDTNNDGTSTVPTRGDWTFPITFGVGSTGKLENAVVRYGGYEMCYNGCQEIPMIKNEGGALSISSSTLSDSPFAAIFQTSGSLDVSNTDFTRDFYALRIDGGLASVVHSNLDAGISISSYSSSPINAVGNWWGDSSGPKYGNDNNAAGARGGWIFGNDVAYVPWLLDKLSVGAGMQAASSSTPNMPVCASDCFSNVLFLPGIEASRLYMRDDSGNENRLWEPNRDNDAALLALGTNQNDVYTKESDIISEAYFSGGPNIYKSFIGRMDDVKARGIIRDWEAIPYDWRLSPDQLFQNGLKSGTAISYLEASSSPYMIQELMRLASSSKTGRVTIVAHSNGGLVAKALMTKLAESGSEHLVDKLIFVAVPQVGTPQAIGSLLHGFGEGIPMLISAKAIRKLGGSMPGAYNLLPSQSYFESVESPVVEFDTASTEPLIESFRNSYGSRVISRLTLFGFLGADNGRTKPAYADLLLPSVLDHTLLDGAQQVHERIDPWIPPTGVSVTEIAGWGLDTVSGIRYYDRVMGEKRHFEYEPTMVSDGDGTVVVPSALAMPTSASSTKAFWVNLKKYNSPEEKIKNLRVVNRGHADILEVGEVLDLIQSRIENKELAQPRYISSSRLIPENDSERLLFFLHSSEGALDIFDAEGNHTGISTTTGFVEEKVPDTAYRMFGNVAYASIKNSPNLEIGDATSSAVRSAHKIKAIISKKSGSNDVESTPTVLDVKTLVGGIVATTTTFTDMAISTSTPVVIEVPLGTSTPPIMVPNESNHDAAHDEATSTQSQPAPVSSQTLKNQHSRGGGGSIPVTTSHTKPVMSQPIASSSVLIHLDVPIERFITAFQGQKVAQKSGVAPASKKQTQTASVFSGVSNIEHGVSMNSIGNTIKKAVKKLLGLFGW